MPPAAERDPQARIGLGLAGGAAVLTGALLIHSANALASDTSGVDVEKEALAAHNNAHTRSIDSFPAPAASLATSQVVESSLGASTSSAETLVPGPNGLVSAEASQATASGQLEDCVDEALDDPLRMWATMFSPGDNLGDRQQNTDGYLQFEPTSAVCTPLVSRETPTARMKMQRPNNHKKFITSKRKELIGNEDGIEGPMNANGSRYGYVTFGRHNGDGNKLRYRCTLGKGITKAWMTYNVRAVSPVDGNILGTRSLTEPIKIARTRRDLVVDNTLPGPC